MISIVGLGNAASSIAECFASTPQYNVYKLNSNVKSKLEEELQIKVF